MRAIVFGYACHCTVLAFYQFCGDYAGFAQIALEKAIPGPRRCSSPAAGPTRTPCRAGRSSSPSVRRAARRSRRSASLGGSDAADRRGRSPRRTRRSTSRSARCRPASRSRPTRSRRRSPSPTAPGSCSRPSIPTGHLAPTYPYPVQVWRLGDLTWVFLGGEVVVDYSLRLKRNLGSSHTWVSGYCNDVMAYIPSLRVLKEGGYEGATAMIYYGLPASWSTDVETQIVDTVDRLVGAVAATK